MEVIDLKRFILKKRTEVFLTESLEDAEKYLDLCFNNMKSYIVYNYNISIHNFPMESIAAFAFLLNKFKFNEHYVDKLLNLNIKEIDLFICNTQKLNESQLNYYIAKNDLDIFEALNTF